MIMRDIWVRKLLGALSQQSILPSGYKLCEYLESTGTQWLETINISRNDILKLQLMFIDRSNLFVFSATDSTNRFHLQTSSMQGYMVVGVGNGYNNMVYVPNGIFNVEVNSNGRTNPIINNIAYPENSTSQYSAYTANKKLLLFGNSTAAFGRYRLYSLSIKDKLNLIPCLDNNNRPCMYDTVTKQTFYNQGKGEFLYKLAKNSGGGY